MKKNNLKIVKIDKNKVISLQTSLPKIIKIAFLINKTPLVQCL